MPSSSTILARLATFPSLGATLATVLVLAACGGGSGGGGGPGPAPCTFTNPVADGADPWVIRQGGFYYFVESRDNGIWVYRSTQLTNLKVNGVKVFAAPASGWNSANIWAPELHYIDGSWYIYYAAGPSGSAGATFVNQRAFVLQGANPQGPYEDKGMLYTGDDLAGRTDDKWAIDMTVERLGGQLYAVWSGWEQNSTTTDRVPQHLYIARMSDPVTISSNRVKISSPTASWERGTELDLEEGPEVLLHDGHTFIIYSTRESWLTAYKLGQLALTGTDPMDPASWTKSGPVFTGTTDVYGVGHASFTVSPDSTEDWIVYHSKRTSTPGWDRVIREQKFGWNADGSPAFGTPVSNNQRIAMPHGQCYPPD